MYLYQDLNRCPSTIDGYKMAIADTLGPAGLHISQSSDLYRLLSSFSQGSSQWAGGRREIVCPGCISGTVRCRKFILGRDIGWGV